MQIDQAKQQAQIAQQQYALQMAQYQKQLAAYEAQQKAIKREKDRRQAEILMRMSQGLLSGQSFGEASLSAYGLNTAPPAPPPSRPAFENYTIRMPNGVQVRCNYSTATSYMDCR